jgi:carbon starvation protein
MLNRESDARFVGYGAMAAESLVAVMALIAACSLAPGDYFAINVSPAVFARLGLHTIDLPQLSAEVGENLAGRTGGGVSLAIGMAHIFRGLPGMHALVSYWYHYAVMFEALFILTTVDAGTRAARYLLQELLGKIAAPFADPKWLPGIVLSTGIIVGSWGYLIYTGSITTIWPLFGTGNQLLATIALAIGTVYLVNNGKLRYAWTTAIPTVFVGITTFTAAVLSIFTIFWPLTHTPGTRVQGYLDSTLMALFLVGVVTVVSAAAYRIWATLHGVPLPPESFAAESTHGTDKIGCC